MMDGLGIPVRTLVNNVSPVTKNVTVSRIHSRPCYECDGNVLSSMRDMSLAREQHDLSPWQDGCTSTGDGVSRGQYQIT